MEFVCVCVYLFDQTAKKGIFTYLYIYMYVFMYNPKFAFAYSIISFYLLSYLGFLYG